MENRKTVVAGIAGYLLFATSLSLTQCIIILLMLCAALFDVRRWLYLFLHTYQRDFSYAKGGFFLAKDIYFTKKNNDSVPKVFRRTVKANPNHVFLVNDVDGKEWTTTQMENYSNQVANYFMSLGFVKGDTISLFMENRPEYIAMWLGLSKIGVYTALINYNLKQDSLLHTIQSAKSKALIFGIELQEAVEEIQSKFSSDFKFFVSSSGSIRAQDSLCPALSGVSVSLDSVLEKQSKDKEPDEITNSIGCFDVLFYIYTSGTTGLPKPVPIRHIRQISSWCIIYNFFHLDQEKVIYCYLPLYHSSGGQLVTALAMYKANKTIIKRKFSASCFWKDCVKYNVHATPYIGEICRYLMAQPEVPEEKQHKVQLLFGNGLRPQIWQQFVDRFNIPRIIEFYGATEGNSNVMNIWNKVGAVGCVNVWLPDFLFSLVLPVYLIKVDMETGDPIRDKRGFCIRCQPHEPGEFIGKIVRGNPVKDFCGYIDKNETSKKIVHNVFRHGDQYFRSGDILVQDEFGYLFFKDRFGDTFRWRGENVATAEVEATISNILRLQDCTVYGVEIPGTEGRAGMAAIYKSEEQSPEEMLEELVRGIKTKLPPYARPIFVRFVEQVDVTGTYKLRKRNLQKEGFDCQVIKDLLFYYDVQSDRFQPLNKELYENIISGHIRL